MIDESSSSWLGLSFDFSFSGMGVMLTWTFMPFTSKLN